MDCKIAYIRHEMKLMSEGKVIKRKDYIMTFRSLILRGDPLHKRYLQEEPGGLFIACWSMNQGNNMDTDLGE